MKKEIGYRIRKIRENLDYSQEYMGEKMGITGGAYAKIERGETDPSVSRLLEIAKLLNVEASSLLDESSQGKVIEMGENRSQMELLISHVNLLTREMEQIKIELASRNAPTKKKK